ncbi:MAG: FMN-binding protein [Oscillospiraceae bacterium]|nr:FMN-binding protein [Oscillospiraceae bacterium]
MKHSSKLFILCLSCLTLLSAFLFSGCNSAPSYTDGSYHAEFQNFDSNGWKEFIDVTIKDGKPEKVVMDAVNQAGDLKSADQEYNDLMKNYSDTYPAKFYQDLATQFLERQDPAKIDAVAGATLSSDNFKKLLAELKPYMVAGITDDVVLQSSSDNA